MKKILIVLLLTLTALGAAAQLCSMPSAYWVFFRDKDLSHSPRADFDQKALDRRAKMGIPFPTVEDYPVNPAYLAQVNDIVEEKRHALRWPNAVAVVATVDQVEQVKNLSFVTAVTPMEKLEMVLAENEGLWTDEILKNDTTMQHLLVRNQRDLVHLQALENAGLTGKGVRIAIFDAGFSGVDFHTAFDHLRAGDQIKMVHDFVGDDEKVYGHSAHGTAVLSCIAGMYEGQRLGAAVDAEFILARTERNLSEPISEEENWMAAAEWADQNGADIISSSLGYTKPRYTYADMTGSKTMVTRAAAMAARKGILVVTSAGNEGNGKFHYISAPADADSVLSVGGSYPMFAYRMPFSSFGPNALGVLKPEISGPGYVLAAGAKGGYRPIGGTSFACPMVAGMAACAMQNWPDESNMQIKSRIMAAGNTAPYFDYALGYGVLDAQRLLQAEASDPLPTFEVESRSDTLWVTIDPAAMALDSAKFKSGKPFSYHFLNPEGKLNGYKTIVLGQKNLKFGLPPSARKEGKTEMWFQGYMWKQD